MTVKLTPEEVIQCESFARQVAEAKKGTYGSSFLKHFTLGIKGEMAYAKIFGLNTNFAIYEGKKGDGGTDFDGVNVKTVSKELTEKNDPWLKVSVKQHNRYRGKVKKYALIIEKNNDEFEYKGSIDYNGFEKIKKVIEFDNGGAYYVKIKDLIK